jgi:uroporphyrinogen-III decarboxylase
MTGKEKIEAAFTKDGTAEIPVVVMYENLFVRDHWEQLTSCPWWYNFMPDIKSQMLWQREAKNKIGQDSLWLNYFYSRKERENISIDVRAEGVFKIDKKTGKEQKLDKPKISGSAVLKKITYTIETPEDIDRLIPIPSKKEGRNDLADALLKEYGDRLFPVSHIDSPLWACCDLFGFEKMMTNTVTRGDLIKYACRRFLDANIKILGGLKLLGAKAIWIEECMTNMISPAAFAEFNVPFLSRLIDEIHSLGLKSIYYFTGNPQDKLKQILSVGTDALALEESKKGFIINIEDIAKEVQGKITLFGNLDPISILQNGTEEQLRQEISRQIAAGRQNNNRFIMSTGSPVTPETPVEKVRLYCDLVRELGTF